MCPRSPPSEPSRTLRPISYHTGQRGTTIGYQAHCEVIATAAHCQSIRPGAVGNEAGHHPDQTESGPAQARRSDISACCWKACWGCPRRKWQRQCLQLWRIPRRSRTEPRTRGRVVYLYRTRRGGSHPAAQTLTRPGRPPGRTCSFGVRHATTHDSRRTEAAVIEVAQQGPQVGLPPPTRSKALIR